MEEELDKYKELYDLSKEVLNEERIRFHKIEDKSYRYFSVLTLLIGGNVFFSKWILEQLIPPKAILEWLLLGSTFILFVILLISWLRIFKALKIHTLKNMPLNTEMITFFDENNPLDIYYALAKSNAEALNYNRDVLKKKVERLYSVYSLILVSVSLLVFIAILFVVYSWTKC